ncbi:protein D1 isoform X1 [Bemisia tabaci]|uniref:protein D1 isoform X1 n=1 Tax=Bemisia tabaci TaxID=7038 RepID=UPI003B27FC80
MHSPILLIRWWNFNGCVLISLVNSVWSWEHPNFTVPVYQDKPKEEIAAALKKHKIVPEVIPRCPEHFIKATYTTDIAKNCTIGLGNILNPNLLDCFPFQLQWHTENGTLYTLMFIDADYPSRENRSQSCYLHWLLGNVPDSNDEYPLPDIFECKHMTRYQGPAPARGTGLHRYIFLVYKQKGKVRFKEPDLYPDDGDDDRVNFSPRDFARKYHLGKPWAVSFYLAEWVQPPPSTTYEPWDFTPETEGPGVGDWSIEEHDEYLDQEREKERKKEIERKKDGKNSK